MSRPVAEPVPAGPEIALAIAPSQALLYGGHAYRPRTATPENPMEETLP